MREELDDVYWKKVSLEFWKGMREEETEEGKNTEETVVEVVNPQKKKGGRTTEKQGED